MKTAWVLCTFASALRSATSGKFLQVTHEPPAGTVDPSFHKCMRMGGFDEDECRRFAACMAPNHSKGDICKCSGNQAPGCWLMGDDEPAVSAERTPAHPPSIFDHVNADMTLKSKDQVILGCVGPSCWDTDVQYMGGPTADVDGVPTGKTDEEAIGRRFDMRVDFKRGTDILTTADDWSTLWHHSWNICEKSYTWRNDPPLGAHEGCRWRDVADGKYDESLIIPGVEHIRTFKKPIVLAICNEAMSGSYVPEAGNSSDYLAMYDHIREVFKQRGVGKEHVVWSWNTFNRPARIRNGKGPGSRMWEEWYPGDAKVDWVGINAFSPWDSNWNLTTPTPYEGRDQWHSIEELYEYFYSWVKTRDVIPFFHAFSGKDNPDDPSYKPDFYRKLPSLVGPGGRFPKIKAVCYYSEGRKGDLGYMIPGGNIQSTEQTRAAAREAFNADVFGGLGRICKPSCADSAAPWAERCTTAACGGCLECEAPPIGKTCERWCPNKPEDPPNDTPETKWERTCKRALCNGCPQCQMYPDEDTVPEDWVPPAGKTCEHWCPDKLEDPPNDTPETKWERTCKRALCNGCPQCV